MDNEKTLLKDKPEYEDYTDNIYYEAHCCCRGAGKEDCNGGSGNCCRKNAMKLSSNL